MKPKSGRFRLIESPKVLLKFAQWQVLRNILCAIPPHEAARGFRSGCSVRDFVEPHTGKEIVVRSDREDFFPSITASRAWRKRRATFERIDWGGLPRLHSAASTHLLKETRKGRV